MTTVDKTGLGLMDPLSGNVSISLMAELGQHHTCYGDTRSRLAAKTIETGRRKKTENSPFSPRVEDDDFFCPLKLKARLCHLQRHVAIPKKRDLGRHFKMVHKKNKRWIFPAEKLLRLSNTIPSWRLLDLTFLTEITEMLNDLNVELQR